MLEYYTGMPNLAPLFTLLFKQKVFHSVVPKKTFCSLEKKRKWFSCTDKFKGLFLYVQAAQTASYKRWKTEKKII